MKLNKNFISHTIDGQTVVVPTAGADFHGLVQGNKTVAVILECLENETTEEAITEELYKRFNGDKELMKADVHDVVSKLKGIGAIDE
jgi:hypothetical protein